MECQWVACGPDSTDGVPRAEFAALVSGKRVFFDVITRGKVGYNAAAVFRPSGRKLDSGRQFVVGQSTDETDSCGICALARSVRPDGAACIRCAYQPPGFVAYPGSV